MVKHRAFQNGVDADCHALRMSMCPWMGGNRKDWIELGWMEMHLTMEK